MNIQDFLNAVLKQDAEQLRTYFSDSAYINWHCTNEHFTVKLFAIGYCVLYNLSQDAPKC